MSFQRRAGAVGFAVLLGMGLQACASASSQQPARVSHHHSAHLDETTDEARQNGHATNVSLAMARKQCEMTARNERGYSRATAGEASMTGPDTARVQLYVGRPFSNTPIGCTYDARAGSAHVP
ncbi:hypothetical protein STIAU_0658 [Stigmatella aurantiaca DW4/3-1]|uniref:Lipoprotein n=1 Tax=Stigmatella aurantiaca (strain DW4/3-1) TaxID=378806 RepID=Q08T98_STIAD|nr:hypothetical protein STIAU_0658 [Stigmatella aurantiaca DW4/3-1]